MFSVLGDGEAGTEARQCEAAGPVHGTAILSLKVDCEGDLFRGGMRIRSQLWGVPSKDWVFILYKWGGQ